LVSASHASYKNNFSKLQSLRREITALDKSISTAHKHLKADFEKWYRLMFPKPDEELLPAPAAPSPLPEASRGTSETEEDQEHGRLPPPLKKEKKEAWGASEDGAAGSYPAPAWTGHAQADEDIRAFYKLLNESKPN
jgi:hypothetical protein